MTAAVLFSSLLKDVAQKRQEGARSQASIDWLREKARAVKTVNPKSLLEDKSRAVSAIEPGSMYLFQYDPKLKGVLPYYDALPLVFPFAADSDGFMGLNMHYLPHLLRARLMDGLYEHLTNEKMDKTTKLNVSYSQLKKASKLKYFEPCIKRYLYSHVKSRFIYIAPSEWDLVLFLPLERFNKASRARVWEQSRNMVV